MFRFRSDIFYVLLTLLNSVGVLILSEFYLEKSTAKHMYSSIVPIFSDTETPVHMYVVSFHILFISRYIALYIFCNKEYTHVFTS